MVTVIGVKFRSAGRLYYFDPGEETFVRGDKVIVETARGKEMGTVSVPNREVDDKDVVKPLKSIIGRATEADLKKAAENAAKEEDAFRRCKEKIRERGLEMKLVSAEYTYDGNKLIFYFTADGRVDFRELVKDLASMFHTRIELRQIGVRDEAMICGGVGICGRALCCCSYLNDFVPVSIKMAKEQNLSLNPVKISGVCGRLMCCLKNEEETYEYLNSRLPNVGETVIDKFEGTKGVVKELSVLKQKVKVLITLDDGSNEVREYSPDEISFKSEKKVFDDSTDDAELKALELEEKEEKELNSENGVAVAVTAAEEAADKKPPLASGQSEQKKPGGNQGKRGKKRFYGKNKKKNKKDNQ